MIKIEIPIYYNTLYICISPEIYNKKKFKNICKKIYKNIRKWHKFLEINC